MLSILIPIYNCNIEKLAAAVMTQCQRLKIDYELLCYDDGSKQKYKDKNNFLSGVFKVNYLELNENLGRAKIRNWLAKSARFDHLLFLDCDSKIIRKDFIKKYIDHRDEADVINGGRIYNKKAPRAKSKILHWTYGTKRESKNAKTRNKFPVIYFHSNNFMATKEVIKTNPFDESFEGYGYEDLDFAKSVLKSNYSILHIDNPVEHLGLEKNKSFLDKQLNAINSLKKRKKDFNPYKTRLEKWNEIIFDWKLNNILLSYFAKNQGKIMTNLLSTKPSLLYLDLFKFYHYNK